MPATYFLHSDSKIEEEAHVQILRYLNQKLELVQRARRALVHQFWRGKPLESRAQGSRSTQGAGLQRKPKKFVYFLTPQEIEKNTLLLAGFFKTKFNVGCEALRAETMRVENQNILRGREIVGNCPDNRGGEVD